MIYNLQKNKFALFLKIETIKAKLFKIKNAFAGSLLAILFFATSCQKEIQIDLNSASPQIIIEGSISDRLDVDTVKLSQTVNYYSSNEFPGVNGAIVTISDDSGYNEILNETDSSHGYYVTRPLKGIPGHTYTLTVQVNGQRYVSVSTMPSPVAIDSLYMTYNVSKPRNGFVGGSQNKNNDTTYEAVFTIHDPAGINNYYHVVQLYNGVVYNSISVFSDRFRDGKTIEPTVRLDTSINVKYGDVFTIELQSIDKGTYDFFRTFRLAAGGSGIGFLSASPGNPISNISNGAIGYFSAYSTNRKSLIIL